MSDDMLEYIYVCPNCKTECLTGRKTKTQCWKCYFEFNIDESNKKKNLNFFEYIKTIKAFLTKQM